VRVHRYQAITVLTLIGKSPFRDYLAGVHTRFIAIYLSNLCTCFTCSYVVGLRC